MFKDWNFKALGLKNASFDENMMLIAFVNYFFAKIWKIMHKYYCFWEKIKEWRKSEGEVSEGEVKELRS